MSPGLPLHKVPQLDIVLISHNHYDHLDEHTVKHVARDHPDAVWVAPLALGGLLRRWGAHHVIELDWWGESTVKGMRITATPARHFSARGLGDRNETLWCGYALDCNGRRAYFAGDTAYHPEFGQIGARCGPFDLVMMPIGAYDPRWFMHIVHMDPEEAVRAYADIIAACPGTPAPRMLGMHWGTFRLTDEPMGEPPLRAAESWRLQGMEASRLWIPRCGETVAW